jgi:hypothetical protein
MNDWLQWQAWLVRTPRCWWFYLDLSLIRGLRSRSVIGFAFLSRPPWEQGIMIWESLRDIFLLLQERNEIDG